MSETTAEHEVEKREYTLHLTIYMVDHTMKIEGEVPNLDTAIAMCDQAKRKFEAQDKMQQALEMRAQLERQQSEARVIESLRRAGN